MKGGDFPVMNEEISLGKGCPCSVSEGLVYSRSGHPSDSLLVFFMSRAIWSQLVQVCIEFLMRRIAWLTLAMIFSKRQPWVGRASAVSLVSWFFAQARKEGMEKTSSFLLKLSPMSLGMPHL